MDFAINLTHYKKAHYFDIHLFLQFNWFEYCNKISPLTYIYIYIYILRIHEPQ